MKNLLKIIVFFTWIIIVSNFLSSCCESNYKYKIIQNDIIYYANEIKEENGCVTFKKYNDNQVKICGTYTIKEYKDYKSKNSKNSKR
jgi:hypothetical protein